MRKKPNFQCLAGHYAGLANYSDHRQSGGVNIASSDQATTNRVGEQLDEGRFDGANRIDELLDRLGPVIDVGIQGVHDRPGQSRVDVGAPLDQINRR
jgi:hypothetical protein